jgi:exonuclease SbcC
MEAQIATYRSELDECGISSERSLEDVERYLAVLDDQISHLRGDQEATMKNMQTDAKRIESLSTENLCPLCFQPLTPEYKDDLIRRIGEENNQRQSSVSQFQNDIGKMQKTKIKINAAISNLQKLQPRIEDLKNRINEDTQSLDDLQKELQAKKTQEDELHTQLNVVRVEISRFDLSSLEDARKQKDNALKNYYSLDSDFKNKENRKKDLTERLNEMKDRIDQAQLKIERREKTLKIIETISGIRDAYRSIQPKLRNEFVKLLRNFVQQILDSLEGAEGPLLNVVIDDTYTPYINSGGGVEREVSNLSGGERTLLAFAYRLGLGQLIMQSRTGHGLSMLLLDEPTESLGREDGSIDRLAEAISRFKAIEQIIAVTHSEAFAEKAEHVIRVDKEADESRISVER